MSSNKQQKQTVVQAIATILEVKAKAPVGPKVLKVPHGTARAKRRIGLVRDWRTTKGAKQMLPPASAAGTAQEITE